MKKSAKQEDGSYWINISKKDIEKRFYNEVNKMIGKNEKICEVMDDFSCAISIVQKKNSKTTFGRQLR